MAQSDLVAEGGLQSTTLVTDGHHCVSATTKQSSSCAGQHAVAATRVCALLLPSLWLQASVGRSGHSCKAGPRTGFGKVTWLWGLCLARTHLLSQAQVKRFEQDC